MFKVIGALIGFWVFGFLGALLGFFIGSAYDRVRMLGLGGANPLTRNHRQQVFLQTIFTLKGKLAKADGHISQAEIDHTEAFMRQLKMSAEQRQQAIEWFKQGSGPDYDVSTVIHEFRRTCGHTANLPEVLLVFLVVIALADGDFDAAEEALLADIARQLGFSDTQFRQILERTLNQTHFAPGQTSQNQLADAYKALGVDESCSDQELKRAYRKLMSQYHPDKLMGQGVPDDMIELGKQQTQEIQAAYELIKRSRAA
ncbi:co-chaperone DjlA [Litorivivens sp.]|uniref:co-chaperone DjlA n=1 Tax=Litorivivens sp. TaxID=2020868 RepID=UPI003567178E